MPSTNRRAFLSTSGVAAMALTTEAAQTAQARSNTVALTGDGLSLTPREYAGLLTTVTSQEKFVRDRYLSGGPVQELEQKFASLLDKESALFLPTGTLANHLAVRVLAGERRHVLVQQESHLYRDESDCAQLLSGLNLVPLGSGRATLSLEEVSKAADQAAGPPYPVPVGAMSIESPVRRVNGRVFDFDEMKKVCSFARERHIRTHLDGARLFLACAYTGISPARHAALFDTVYISLYKYFNAPFGAVLAGTREVIDKVSALRHQFGSAIFQGWETAAVALHYFDGFEGRYAQAARNGETLFRLLEADGRFKVERFPSGSNVFGFRLTSGGALDSLRERLAQAGVIIGAAKNATQTTIQINETINRRPPEEIARLFSKALG